MNITREELTSHKLEITSCDEDSPLAKFMRRDGKIVLIGVGYNSCTAFHVVEQKMNVPYMAYRINDKAKYRMNGQLFPLPSKMLLKGFKYDFTIVEPELIEKGIVREEKIGCAIVKILRSSSFQTIIENRLKQDPNCFFKGYC